MSITSLTRSAVYGQNGMVSSDSPLAASVGLRVLQDGGTAFDAALAVAAVECVTIVPMCGLGGDSFILAYDANSDTVTNINSSGAAAAGAKADYYRQQGLALMPIAGPHSVSVPGEAAAWERCTGNSARCPLPNCWPRPSDTPRTVFRCRHASPGCLPTAPNCWAVSAPLPISISATADHPVKVRCWPTRTWPPASDRLPRAAPTLSIADTWPIRWWPD